MSRRSLFLVSAAAMLVGAAFIIEWSGQQKIQPEAPNRQTSSEKSSMTTTSAIVTDINNFIADQDTNRGQAVAGGGAVPIYFNALTGAPVAGESAATGIAGISSGMAAITLPAGQPGNAVIIDGAVSTAASTSGADSYSLLISSSGAETLTDNNTGNSVLITDAAYFVFDGGAKAASGAYQSAFLVEGGVYAEVASMYNAAFGRVPDFPGLEFNAIPVAKGVLSLHDLADDFLVSKEFYDLYLGGNGSAPTIGPADNGGPNDVAFITKLYGQILHRTPTTNEVDFYVNALQNTPGTDRAQLLIYFSVSPENQKDISATNGGWLINPANGAVSLGAMSAATATTVVTNEIASGTVNASDFSGLSSSSQVSGPSIVITGANYGAGTGAQQADPEVSTTAPNVTINLSAQYFLGAILGSNETLNGVPTGGTIADVPSSGPFSAALANGGGTVNLFGNANWVELGNPTYAVTVPTVINGWNSTDVMVAWGGTAPSYFHSAASLLANPDGVVFEGSAASPVQGASQSFSNAIAVNVGPIANDSVSAVVAAANQAYRVGDVPSENAFFFGQDPQGNTMVFWWRGDHSNIGSVQASDMTGAIELVGVQAGSLTSVNFHH